MSLSHPLSAEGGALEWRVRGAVGSGGAVGVGELRHLTNYCWGRKVELRIGQPVAEAGSRKESGYCGHEERL